MISAARTTKPAKKAQLNGLAHRVPPLQNGDQMTQKDFHRRNLAMPKEIKAELIDGVVYMWLDPTAIIKGDMVKALEIVKQGIASPEHRRFVKKLRVNKK